MEHIRVLVVDDHSLVRAGFRSILGDEDDIDVVGEAKDGAEAVEATARERPDFGRWRNFGHSAGFARSAAIEEVRQNDYDLQPRRYVREQTSSRDSLADAPSAGLEALLRQLDELTERAKRAHPDIGTHLKVLHDSTAGEWSEVPLGRICDIQAGPGTVKREHGLTGQGWTPIVLPRNIRRSHLSHDALDTVRPEISAKLVNYRIRPGDIVCARSGTLGRHALVREAEGGWLLGPSCMRLRPAEDEVVPEYLVHYLNSPEVHRWITSESRGSTAIPHISTATMRELAIPLPSIAAQRDIAAMMDSIDIHIQQHQRAASAMQSLRDLLFPSLMQSLLNGQGCCRP